MKIPHNIPEEFPDAAALIVRLKASDYEFRRLLARYDRVNSTIYRIESEVEPTADAVLENFKKERLMFKDQIAAALARAKPA